MGQGDAIAMIIIRHLKRLKLYNPNDSTKSGGTFMNMFDSLILGSMERPFITMVLALEHGGWGDAVRLPKPSGRKNVLCDDYMPNPLYA